MEHFTSAQKEAVLCNDSEILVSAAAGSGKTAVLTERIIRHVSEGVDINRLLVVTFTEAASAEMRERIEKKLVENEKLAHQTALLPTADISTIHAFCRKLIKENFQEIDIDPAFRVADDAELSLVKSLVMDELFENEYENEDFLDLADVYGGKTTDVRLETLIREIYEFMESDPFPAEAARRYAAVFNEIDDIDSTIWAEIAREELAFGLQGVLDALRRAVKICNAPAGPQKYIEKLHDEIEMIRDLIETTKKSFFSEIYDAFKKIDWGRLPTISKKDEVNDELKDRVQRIRNKAVKDRVKNLTNGVFFAAPEKMISDLQALAPRVNALMRLAQLFSEKFAKEKRERNIMDFSDLEHYAIRILYPFGPEDMTPKHLEQKYYEVLIDEYQDSNEIQDLILSAVALRRFMVGDVKQSIYRFRRADPTLFLKKYNTGRTKGTVHSSRESLDGTVPTAFRIDLSNNFRSRPEVLGAVNFFFSRLMNRQLGDVDYDDNAALHAGHAEYPSLDGLKMQIELLDQEDDTEEEDEDEPVSNVIAETRVLAECINELLQKGYKQGDIAILTRSFSAIAGEVTEELKNHGIDAIADINEGFFEKREIKTALAFLRITDNPRTDIDLITALTSPVYAFDADELFEISRASIADGGDFYDRLTAFARENEKAKKFLADLEKWRAAAVYMPISRLIGYVYDSTEYPSHVANMPAGAVRQANLRLLLERAIEFEETSMKGLFHFIRYVERLSAAGNVASAAEPSADFSDKVRLMTIHKSKGLEFPVVICAFLAKKFNTADERRSVIMHSAKGIGAYYVNTKLRTRANTLARFALTRLIHRENLSEELRCLYVAMTRAKELLILTGRAKNLEKSMEKWTDNIGVSSYLDWLMPCLLREKEEAEKLFRIREHRGKEFAFSTTKINTKNTKKDAENEDNGTVFLPCASEDGKTAPLSSENRALPSKLSISEIKRLYDITPDSSFHDSAVVPTFDPPAFIKAESGITPMRMGSVLHTITEHINYERHVNLAEIDELILCLTKKNLLSPEEAAAIEREKILSLANSPLAERLRKASAAQKLFRETPFVLALTSSQLYPEIKISDETILVHGIIDCHFEEDGKLILLDFKSDKIPHSTPLNEWAENHRIQLEIYKQALEASANTEVSEILLYSFSRGETATLTMSAKNYFRYKEH
ncbi:MAG: helicase-exonuclease AddAB subunit AddA [Clostridiales bacterium]|nr:helicase-exonuclease AddAB subunit AddA [Clostridiales bacterium]